MGGNHSEGIGGVSVREHIVHIQSALILGLGVIIVMLLMKDGGDVNGN